MRNLSGLNDLNSLNNLSGLNDLFSLISSKKLLSLMFPSILAPKWPLLCGMGHQKLNILLIFGTFSFGGCGGQGCYFWPNPRVISKKSAIQDSQITFKPKLACIFLPARAKWNINVCVETPCTRKWIQKNKLCKIVHSHGCTTFREFQFHINHEQKMPFQ